MPKSEAQRIIRSKNQSWSAGALHNRSFVVSLIIAVAFVAYLIAFLNQPSVLGFVGVEGEPLARWVDVMQMLLLESLFSAMSGGGELAFGVLDRLPVLVFACVYLLVAWWIGLAWVTLASSESTIGRVEFHSFCVLSGLALMSTLTLLVGSCLTLSSRWPLALALVAFVCLTGGLLRCRPDVWRQAWDRITTPRAARKSLGKPNSGAVAEGGLIVPNSMLAAWLLRLIPVAAIGLGTIYMLGSLMPAWEFDVVEYHLQAPKEFFQAGRIGFNLHNVYANMPLGAEMHSLAAMTLISGDAGWWWGGLVGKAIIGMFSLVAAGLLGGFVGRQFGATGGWCAAGLLLAVPGNAHVATAGLIDMVLGAYLLASLIILEQLSSIERGAKASAWKVFLLCLMCGAAAACKYTGLPFVVVPVLALLAAMWLRRLAQFRIDGIFVASTVGLLVTCVPWYLKNWILAGNPFFPLGFSWLGGKDFSPSQAAQWSAAHQVPRDDGGLSYSLQSFLRSLSQVVLESQFLQPSLVFLAVVGLAACVVMPPPSVSRAVKCWMISWAVVAVWIFCVWYFATHRIDRFWMPLMPVFAAFAGVGTAWIAVRGSTALSAGIVLVGLFYGMFINVSGAMGDNRFFVSLAALRADAGNQERPGRLPPAIGWINANFARTEARFLLVGEARVFDFQVPVVYATCFNTNPGETWLSEKTEAEQIANLRQAGITHVLINWSEIERYRSPGNYGFSAWPERSDIEKMVDEGVLRTLPTPLDPNEVQILEVAKP